MSGAPDVSVQRAFTAPTSSITRRVEIYEHDGTTPWKRDLWPSILVGGSVNAEYDRDERRTFEVTLDNTFGDLDVSTGNLWYDKIFKVFYGINVDEPDRKPRVCICEESDAPGQGIQLKIILSSLGLNEVHFNPYASRYEDIKDYDIIVSISSSAPSSRDLLAEAMSKGVAVISFAPKVNSETLPEFINGASSIASGSGGRVFDKNESMSSDVGLGWDSWVLREDLEYSVIKGIVSGRTVAAYCRTEGNNSPGAFYLDDPQYGMWTHVLQSRFDADVFRSPSDMESFKKFLGRVVDQSFRVEPIKHWETQIGEFVLDSISDEGDTRDRIKVTGRDYAKRCMLSKLPQAVTFAGKQDDHEAPSIREVITALASNAGVRKIRITAGSERLGKDMTWERDTSRWDIIKEIAESKGYQVFFDNEGYLVMKSLSDPSEDAPTFTLSAGPDGNIVSRSTKSSDTKLFNRVTVVGESSDSTTPLAFGEAINTSPDSPSSVERIGERTLNISSPLVTTNAEAEELAKKNLSVSALEEFQIDFSSILLPWVEPGDIMEACPWTDRMAIGPKKYLLSSLTLPLDLTPMSGNGKRVVKVL